MHRTRFKREFIRSVEQEWGQERTRGRTGEQDKVQGVWARSLRLLSEEMKLKIISIVILVFMADSGALSWKYLV